MKVGSLFAGIGGFDLGLQRAGMEIVWQVETDDYCNKVLAKHWPEVKRYGDIRRLHGVTAHAKRLGWKKGARKRIQSKKQITEGQNSVNLCQETLQEACENCLPPVDLICGGFPCQPFSVAGRRKGKADDRYLWPEMFRIISEIRPRWVLGENVAGIKSMVFPNSETEMGNQTNFSQSEILEYSNILSGILNDLERIGYSVQTFCIPACGVGAPHRRDRIWIVAYSEHNRCKRENLSISVGKSFEESVDIASYSKIVVQPECMEPTKRVEERMQSQKQIAEGQNLKNVCPETQNMFRSFWTSDRAVIESNVGRGPDGFPVWLYRHCGRGLSYTESLRRTEVLRKLWTEDISKKIWLAVRRLERMEKAEVLFAFAYKYEKNPDQARLLLENQKAFGDFVQSIAGEQFSEHSDLNSEAPWMIASWEDGIPRVTKRIKNRVDRLRCLGNAVVPQIVEVIGRAIMEVDSKGK